MTGRKTFYKGDIAHVYQRAVKSRVLFYDFRDMLVYFTTACVVARRHDVSIDALCIMLNHLHLLLEASGQEAISSFMQELNSRFTKEYGKDLGQVTKVFGARFSQSNKFGDKSKRNAIAYLYNNYVEKKAASKAEDVRWNFLAYAFSEHPFSEKLVVRRSSTPLRKVLAEVNFFHGQGKALTYHLIDKWMKMLAKSKDQKTEKAMLIDYIIMKYNVIDYSNTFKYYKSPEAMLLAINSNTGSDYEIGEVAEKGSYREYKAMFLSLIKDHGLRQSKDVLRLPEEKRHAIAQTFLKRRLADRHQVETLLHIDLD